jgi:hypothetical protein
MYGRRTDFYRKRTCPSANNNKEGEKAKRGTAKKYLGLRNVKKGAI